MRISIELDKMVALPQSPSIRWVRLDEHSGQMSAHAHWISALHQFTYENIHPAKTLEVFCNL